MHGFEVDLITNYFFKQYRFVLDDLCTKQMEMMKIFLRGCMHPCYQQMHVMGFHYSRHCMSALRYLEFTLTCSTVFYENIITRCDFAVVIRRQLHALHIRNGLKLLPLCSDKISAIETSCQVRYLKQLPAQYKCQSDDSQLNCEVRDFVGNTDPGVTCSEVYDGLEYETTKLYPDDDDHLLQEVNKACSIDDIYKVFSFHI